jgi:hypothetical protein
MALVPIIGLIGLAYVAIQNNEEEETYVPVSDFNQGEKIDDSRLIKWVRLSS